MSEEIQNFIRSLYGYECPVPLHEPSLGREEQEIILECLKSGYVSSAGPMVGRFELDFSKAVNSPYAISMVSGTAALHMGLLVCDVGPCDEVLTQSLSFVATCNAIHYTGARPTFIDISPKTLGLCPDSLQAFLEGNTHQTKGGLVNKNTGNLIKAVIPMHVFGLPCEIDKIARICQKWNLVLIEDAAEGLGSKYKGQQVGTFGDVGIFSFNGNKIITAGGGGMLVTADEKIAERAKHLSTTAKVSHPWLFQHDEIGYNYRMPNINAALGIAQLGKLDVFLREKRMIAAKYQNFFENRPELYVTEPDNSHSNFWLNAIVFPSGERRDFFIKNSNQKNIFVRPVWEPIHNLTMFKSCDRGPLIETNRLADLLVNLPSSPIKEICNGD